MAVALKLENYSFAYPGVERWTLREISMEIRPGECHCLTGATGSGKTTLALALKGLLPPGRQVGRLLLPASPGRERAAVGLVLQNPETQLLTETIGNEVAFGLENLCLPPRQMPERVRAALTAVGLDLPFDHPTGQLSMGRKYRLLVAGQLVLEPALLIFDEPAGQLDASGLRSLAAVISRLKRQGIAVLLCEHRPGPLASVIDCNWHLDGKGRMQSGRLTQPEPEDRQRVRTRKHDPNGSEPVLEIRQLAVDTADASPAWDEASLVLQRGERVLLCAPNGAGKTTLLRCLAGFLRPRSGGVRLFGEPPEPKRLRGRVGFLFQNPRRQLFETTVFDEVAFSLRRLGMSSADRTERVGQTLQRCGITELSGDSPHRLSYGQQHLVALATVLAPEPELLLLDDPLAGLDSGAAETVGAALFAASEERGTTVLWTSHHPQPSSGWYHRSIGIEGGRFVDL